MILPWPDPGALARARDRHREDRHWLNFARHILGHPLVRQTLWKRQAGRCAWCQRPLRLNRFAIHHLSYDHCCVTDRAGRDQRRRGPVPPCRDCAALTECLARLAALCRCCHRRLHRPSTLGIEDENRPLNR